MARYKDELVTNVLKEHLHQGEELKNWAYGIKQPPIILLIVLVLIAIIPGVIAMILLTKEYIVGLTDKRIIVLTVKGGKADVKEVMEYDLASIPMSFTSTGVIFTVIKVTDEAKPLEVKFHRAGMKENRMHSIAIAKAFNPNHKA